MKRPPDRNGAAFADELKYVFHGVRRSGVCGVLTAAALVLTFFILLLAAGLGYSVYQSLYARAADIVQSGGVRIEIDKTSRHRPEGAARVRLPIEPAGAEELLGVLCENPAYIAYAEFRANAPATDDGGGVFNLVPFDTVYNAYGGDENITLGRVWTAADAGKDTVWLSDKIDAGRYPEGRIRLTVAAEYREFEIAGYVRGLEPGRVLLEYHAFNAPVVSENAGGLAIFSVYGVLPAGNAGGAKNPGYYKQIRSRAAALPVAFSVYAAGGEILDVLDILDLAIAYIAGAAGFIAAAVLLLALGCVTNAVRYSAERNRKFYALLRGLGARKEAIGRLQFFQTLALLLAAVCVATAAAYAVIGAFLPIVTAFLEIAEIPVAFAVCRIPFWMPLSLLPLLCAYVFFATRAAVKQSGTAEIVFLLNEGGE